MKTQLREEIKDKIVSPKNVYAYYLLVWKQGNLEQRSEKQSEKQGKEMEI